MKQRFLGINSGRNQRALEEIQGFRSGSAADLCGSVDIYYLSRRKSAVTNQIRTLTLNSEVKRIADSFCNLIFQFLLESDGILIEQKPYCLVDVSSDSGF